MTAKSIFDNIPIDKLILDVNNPRFAELYSGSHKEEDLIEYLLFTEAAEEVAKAIVKADEFHPDRPLWVIKSGDNYLVKDGNRRCSAVKALQLPGKYKLSLPKTTIDTLPVLIYNKESDLDARIAEEHAGNLFRKWERIAKALEVLKFHEAGKHEDVREMDSKPGDLIKLASFYKEAVKIGGDDLRQLLRRGRGKTGGKTIIFERLFKYSKSCGYSFKNSPSFKAEITESEKFSKYIKALVEYLKFNPDTTTDTIDKDSNFLKKLKEFGFDINANTNQTPSSQGAGSSVGEEASTSTVSDINTNSNPTPTVSTNGGVTNGANTGGQDTSTGVTTGVSPTNGSGSKRGTVKNYPLIKRKQFPLGLKSRIDEYFKIDSSLMPNAKIAMARVTYECVLKYVVEHTKHGSIIFKNSGYFGAAYSRKPYTNFEEMNKKFIELITDTGINQAFKNFEFDKMHQTIHNYHVSSKTIDAEQIKANLIVLLEFMLQDTPDLLNSLDVSKIL